jgi:hypothetical protein
MCLLSFCIASPPRSSSLISFMVPKCKLCCATLSRAVLGKAGTTEKRKRTPVCKNLDIWRLTAHPLHSREGEGGTRSPVCARTAKSAPAGVRALIQGSERPSAEQYCAAYLAHLCAQALRSIDAAVSNQHRTCISLTMAQRSIRHLLTNLFLILGQSGRGR